MIERTVFPGATVVGRAAATLSPAAALLLLLVPAVLHGQMAGMAGGEMMHQQEAPAFIEVSATATVAVPADRGEVRFAVETQSEAAATASAENASKMETVIRSLRALEIEGLDIETSGYQLSPIYMRASPGEVQEIRAYRALNHVVVTVDDVDALGGVIDAGIGGGANRVAGLSFSASDTEAARRTAVQRAIVNARGEAEAMAEALGIPLGPPLEVRGGAQAPNPVPYLMEARAMQAVDTPVEPGEQIVRASVTIKFRLGTGS